MHGPDRRRLGDQCNLAAALLVTAITGTASLKLRQEKCISMSSRVERLVFGRYLLSPAYTCASNECCSTCRSACVHEEASHPCWASCWLVPDTLRCRQESLVLLVS